MTIPHDWNHELDQARDNWLRSVKAFLATEPDTDPESGDTPEYRMKLARAATEEAYGRDRDQLIGVTPFGADTLIGSYFRAPDQQDSNAEAAWIDGEACRTVEGMVVAQPLTTPQGATYLVEFYGTQGAAGYQQLVELDRMVNQRWTFYDTDAWLTQRRESEREAAAAALPDDGSADLPEA